MKNAMAKRLASIFLAIALALSLIAALSFTLPAMAEEGSGGEEEPAGPSIADPIEGFTKYEAEDAQVENTKIGDYGGPYSGTGFVGEIDLSTSSVTFTVTVAEEGEYAMKLAYAIGESFQPGSLRIYNDAGYYTQANCTTIHDWGIFDLDAVADCRISLRAGENKVSVRKGTNNVQVDFIAIGERVGDYIDKDEEPSDAPAVPEGYTRYEAEEGYVVNASAKGRAFKNDYGSGYSGGGFVGNMNDASHYVDIPVTVAESGAYTINLRYASASLVVPTYKVYVGRYGENGYLYSYGTVSLTVRNGWGTFTEDGVVDMEIALEAGESFVRVVPEYDYAELDCIEIGARTGDYYKGTDESAIGSGGDNEFDDDFFADEKDDGYVQKGGCGSSLGVSALGCAAIAVLAAAILIFIRRKNNEKIR